MGSSAIGRPEATERKLAPVTSAGQSILGCTPCNARRLVCGPRGSRLLWSTQEGRMSVLLGAIADDFTGATDLCNTLVRRGMKTVQLIDVPAPGAAPPDAEAVVIALKSRTIPAADAVAMSLKALAWLQDAGARQILFKY